MSDPALSLPKFGLQHRRITFPSTMSFSLDYASIEHPKYVSVSYHTTPFTNIQQMEKPPPTARLFQPPHHPRTSPASPLPRPPDAPTRRGRPPKPPPPPTQPSKTSAHGTSPSPPPSPSPCKPLCSTCPAAAYRSLAWASSSCSSSPPS